MEETHVKPKDKWQITLDNELEKLKRCQSSKNLNSCLKCELALTCEIRKEYILAVYESMNKGSGGGFEF
jgi:hypothetical protein